MTVSKTQPRFLITGVFLDQRMQLSLILAQWTFQKPISFYYPSTWLSERNSADISPQSTNTGFALIGYYGFFCIQISQSALEEESRTEQQSSFQTGGEIRAKAQPFAFALWPSAIKIHQARQTSSIVTHILCGRAMNCKKERESSMMLIYFHMHVLLCYSRYPELMQCITMPQLCFSHSQTFVITVQVKDRDVLHAVYYYYATVFN